MRNRQGDFIWYELMTTNADAAAAFYSAVLGWEISASGQPDMDYRIICASGSGVGGLLALTPEMIAGGARTAWMGYIGVDDVDASVAALLADGGSVHLAAFDVPGVGRIAMVADPQGAVFYLMRGAVDAVSTAFCASATGHCGWNELTTDDDVAAVAFYSAHFGWTEDGGMPMGDMGTYRFIAQGGQVIGAVMRRPPQVPVNCWSYYFRVADIDQAVAAVAAGGGSLLFGPEEVPGEQWIIHGLDPQGGHFALVGARS